MASLLLSQNVFLVTAPRVRPAALEGRGLSGR
jgi:hypothetical protein